MQVDSPYEGWWEMKRLLTRLGRVWCQAMHPAPMWPIRGQYTCPVCLRSYPVPWEQGPCEANGRAPSRQSVAPAVPAIAAR